MTDPTAPATPAYNAEFLGEVPHNGTVNLTCDSSSQTIDDGNGNFYAPSQQPWIVTCTDGYWETDYSKAKCIEG